MIASARAVQMEHAINPDFKIGYMVLIMPAYPLMSRPEDAIEVMKLNHQRELFLEDQARGQTVF